MTIVSESSNLVLPHICHKGIKDVGYFYIHGLIPLVASKPYRNV